MVSFVSCRRPRDTVEERRPGGQGVLQQARWQSGIRHEKHSIVATSGRIMPAFHDAGQRDAFAADRHLPGDDLRTRRWS